MLSLDIAEPFGIVFLASAFIVALLLAFIVGRRVFYEKRLNSLTKKLRVDAKMRRARNAEIGNNIDIDIIKKMIKVNLNHAKRLEKIVKIKKLLRKNYYVEKVYCEELARESFELCKKQNAILRGANVA